MMHRALQTPDIVREICEHIFPFCFTDNVTRHDLPGPSTKRDLLNLALTCRGLSSPALDRLWWALDDLTSLFKLIPGFQTSPIGYLGSPLDPERDFRVFDRYAGRVRLYKSEPKETVLASSIFQISQARNGRPILPSLLYLDIEGGKSGLSPLLSPSLLSIGMRENERADLSFSKPNLWAMLNAIPGKATNLRSLAIKDNVELPKECMYAISKMENLTRLEFSSTLAGTFKHQLDYDTAMALSKLRNLQYLAFDGRLDFQDTQNIHATDGLQDSSFFPSLRRLDLCTIAWTIPALCKFLQMGVFRDLQRLKLRLGQPLIYGLSRLSVNDVEAIRQLHLKWPAFFRALKGCTTPNFKFLSIDNSLRQHDLTPMSAVDDLFLLDLEELHVSNRVFSKVVQTDLLRLVEAWPNLKSLSIVAEQWDVQFDSLVQIAQKSVKLQSLKIGLDVRNLRYEPPEVPLLSHRLERIQLTVSGQTSFHLLARLVDKIFPHLSSCAVLRKHSSYDDGDLVSDVGMMVRYFQAARADEVVRRGL
ncbi:hypothetical protein CVT26_009091 [Gymnopilus dilepis]|uniref:F-box domain-containing protein n=1 Tax=Gymnopilus dilepis TaxID=231916 RepID=A0A409WUK0_9AGAR|nr:hypothetical protein CVT26_009091 [Gymnopilus dilepis]